MSKKRFLTQEQKIIVYDLYKDNQPISWLDFRKLCNTKLNEDFNEIVYRRYIQVGLDFTKNHCTESNSILQLLETRKLNTLLKASLNKDIAFKVHYDLFKSEIQTNIKVEVPTLLQSSIMPLSTNKTHLFILADMQEDGSGYSHNIFDRCYNEIEKIIIEKNLTHIELWENGDGVDGALRTSALAQNVKSIVGQIQIYWNALANLLLKLSKLPIIINFSIVTSNHTELRLFGTGRGEMKEDDVTYLILETIRWRLQNIPNIVFSNVTNYKIHNYSKYKVFQHHGDNKMNVRNLEQYFKNIVTYYEPIDYVIVSHVHHFRYTTVNSGLKNNDYAVITTPALDPRLYKNNEQWLMVSSEPAFLYIEFQENLGISEIRKLHTNFILKDKPEVSILTN